MPGACRRRRRGRGARSAVRRRGDVFLGACRRGRRRGGLRGDVFLGACRRGRRHTALLTWGSLGRYGAVQWHLARAVGKRFRGCRAKRLYVYYQSQATRNAKGKIEKLALGLLGLVLGLQSQPPCSRRPSPSHSAHMPFVGLQSQSFSRHTPVPLGIDIHTTAPRPMHGQATRRAHAQPWAAPRPQLLIPWLTQWLAPGSLHGSLHDASLHNASLHDASLHDASHHEVSLLDNA